MKAFVPFVFMAIALSARAELLLKGIAIAGGEPAFSLYSVEDKTSKWVTLGKSFSGFKLLAFDPGTEVLTLGKGDARQEIRLQNARIKDSSAEDAKARLRFLKGIDLAYELAKQGDVELREKLRAYQNILSRYNEASSLSQEMTPQVTSAMKFLSAQIEKLRAECEKTAETKAVLLLQSPATP